MSDVELYEFRRGTVAWRYTSRRKPLVYQTQTYAPAAMSRGEISQSAELQRCALDITVPLDLPVLGQIQPVATLEKISVLVRLLPAGDTVARGIWGGQIANVEDNDRRAIIHCLPPSAAFRTTGLRGCWQKNCRHSLYGARCGANAEAMRVNGMLIASTNASVSSAAFAAYPDGWFAGGWITWMATSGLLERRFITDHTGATLKLLTAANVPVGTVAAAYPGCNHTGQHCNDKFHNIPNYGGQMYIPPKVPFNNNPGF